MNKYETITNIKERQIAFLDDTAKHYNIFNRNDIHGECRYLPINDSSEGCAIGRYLDKCLAKRMDEREFGSPGVSNMTLFNKLPTWMKEMGNSFLCNIQILHDDFTFWNEQGLSNKGSLNVDRIKSNIEVGIYSN